MGYLFKQALKTLCRVNHWSYAVFWKFGLQNAKLLIWEECYNQEIPLQDCIASSVSDEAPDSQYLVNKMMMENHVNIVGEGLVGRVAFTGNHQWMLSENYHTEAHPPEVLKEVYQQFSSGMQTVAVIPVLPYGVIQFGSSLRIVEDMEFVKDVVSIVSELGHVPGVLQSHGYATELLSNMEVPPFQLYSTHQEPNHESCRMNASSFTADGFGISNGGYSGQTSTFASELPHLLTGEIHNGMQCAEAEVIPSTFDTANLYSGFVEDCGRQKTEGQSFRLDETNSIDAFIQHQSGDDLFDILGADFKNRLFPSDQPAAKIHDSDSGIFSTGPDYLLDAVVSNVHLPVDQSFDDNVSCRTTLTNTSSSSEVKALAPYNHFALTDHTKAKGGSTEKKTLPPPKEDTGSYSQCSSIYDSWFEKGHQMKHTSIVSTGYSKKSQEINKASRKRLKPGENPRPRPKDRQMIQDRLKELREIVPNGAKCSIDALLERTIKHMCFLQSLSKHANKLNLTPESKIVSKDGSLLLKDNFEGGATWAYEVGSQSMVCPIIVEDLDQPRQMLVEMLCEKRGLFLEIADVIRGLGLTILKGLMETRNDKIWARFSVEANRDITRMEIFLSLVRLLQHNAESCNPNTNDMIPEDEMIQQFHAGGSIPGTLRSETIKIC